MSGKTEIRKAMRAERRKVAPSARIAVAEDVSATILAREDVKAAIAAHRPFAVYIASFDEIDLGPLIGRLWAADCHVFVPAWRNGAYSLVRYAQDSVLVAGPMGILEPRAVRGESDGAEPAVWIVPGLAFTRKGARLGYGGGWYDRFLSAARQDAVTLGVAYPFQIVDELPCEGHDVSLTSVIVGGET